MVDVQMGIFVMWIEGQRPFRQGNGLGVPLQCPQQGRKIAESVGGLFQLRGKTQLTLRFCGASQKEGDQTALMKATGVMRILLQKGGQQRFGLAVFSAVYQCNGQIEHRLHGRPRVGETLD